MACGGHLEPVLHGVGASEAALMAQVQGELGRIQCDLQRLEPIGPLSYKWDLGKIWTGEQVSADDVQRASRQQETAL